MLLCRVDHVLPQPTTVVDLRVSSHSRASIALGMEWHTSLAASNGDLKPTVSTLDSLTRSSSRFIVYIRLHHTPLLYSSPIFCCSNCTDEMDLALLTPSTHYVNMTNVSLYRFVPPSMCYHNATFCSRISIPNTTLTQMR